MIETAWKQTVKNAIETGNQLADDDLKIILSILDDYDRLRNNCIMAFNEDGSIVEEPFKQVKIQLGIVSPFIDE